LDAAARQRDGPTSKDSSMPDFMACFILFSSRNLTDKIAEGSLLFADVED
jgi:hypothetical protein